MKMLSMTGLIGVESLPNSVVDKLNVSPGNASSMKIGISSPALNVVFTPCDLSNVDL